MRVEFVMIDILHTVDQCVANHVTGNAFDEALRAGVLGDNYEANLKELTDNLQ